MFLVTYLKIGGGGSGLYSPTDNNNIYFSNNFGIKNNHGVKLIS